MYLTDENLNLVKENDSQVVSMKYLDLQGNLNQIDFLAKNILADYGNHGFEIDKNICLFPIQSKGFLDPFRSLPTTSFLCTNIANKLDNRKFASNLIENTIANLVTNFEAELTFWIEDKDEKKVLGKCDPYDTYSNLRSDILTILESINIETTIHRLGTNVNEEIIGFKGKNIIDLADNYILVKFIIDNVATNYGKKVSFTKNKAYNLKLILTANKNNEVNFIKNLATNNSLMLECNEFLQINNLSYNAISEQKIFSNDCEISMTLTVTDNFIPYVKFALILLYFSDHNYLVQRLKEKEFNKIIEIKC